jgi:hypothetical protein
MRYAIAALLFVVACKKESPTSGLPPAQDWKGAPSGAPVEPSANPHAANPHSAVDTSQPDPHAGIAPSATPPTTLAKLPDGTLALGPFSVAAPSDWTVKPITSSMRAADFDLPAAAGQEAELIVYYFGEGGAGSTQDNLDRWLGQFTQPDGKPSKDVAKVEKTKLAGQEATIVAVSGHFASMAMPGGSAVDKQDQAMLAAIVASPSGPYYFKLVGAKKTVDTNAAKFRAMLTSLKLR